jgi:uncharacterized protein
MCVAPHGLRGNRSHGMLLAGGRICSGRIRPEVSGVQERAINPQSAGACAVSAADCLSCGACCAYSREWPRFSLESDADLARIPPTFVDDEHGRMRCHGDRCTALVGEVGIATSCAIYAVRPEVCRACEPGDEACRMARRHFKLLTPPAPP